MRPKLTLVPDCGSLISVAARVDIGAQLMPANQPAGRGLNGKNLLRSNAPLVVQPLPNHSLCNADSFTEGRLTDAVPLEVRGKLHGPILATIVEKVNSKLLGGSRKVGHASKMAKRKRPKPGEGIPKAVLEAEGKALAALWKSRAKRTQAEFADDMEFSQGNFSHYVGGRRPIPLDVGIAITEELGCQLADFSPRLAAELLEADNTKLAAWPFFSVSPERISRLTPGKRLQFEGVILEELDRIEGQAARSRKAPRQ